MQFKFFLALERFTPILKMFFGKNFQKLKNWKMAYFDIWCAQKVFFLQIGILYIFLYSWTLYMVFTIVILKSTQVFENWVTGSFFHGNGALFQKCQKKTQREMHSQKCLAAQKKQTESLNQTNLHLDSVGSHFLCFVIKPRKLAKKTKRCEVQT